MEVNNQYGSKEEGSEEEGRKEKEEVTASQRNMKGPATGGAFLFPLLFELQRQSRIVLRQ